MKRSILAAGLALALAACSDGDETAMDRESAETDATPDADDAAAPTGALAGGGPAPAESGAAMPWQTGARTVRCEIERAGFDSYAGPCLFRPERGGSFTVTGPRSAGAPADLLTGEGGSVNTISVAIVEPGVAEVRGLTDAGINSRWGIARRSQADGACWEAESGDFRVCAR